MIARIALLVIAVAIVLAISGRLRRSKIGRKASPRVEAAHKCAACGAYVIEGQPCGCGRG